MEKLLNYAEHLNSLFWSRVCTSTKVNKESLGLFRILAGLLILLFYFPNYFWIGDAPTLFYNPPKPSLGQLFDGFPPSLFFQLSDVTLLISVLCITIGVRAKFFSILFVALSVILITFNYSFGKIDHTILVYASFGCLAFSGWGNRYAIVPDKYDEAQSHRALALLGVIIAFGMFTAGLPKLSNWANLDFSSNGFLSWYYKGKLFYGRNYLLAPYLGTLPNETFKLFDFAAILFELSAFLMLLWSPKAWRIWLMAAVVFHIMVILLLNISFTSNLFAYLPFLSYERIFKKFQLQVKGFMIGVLTISLSLFAIRLFLLITHANSSNLFRGDLVFGIFVWIGALVFIILDFLLYKKSVGGEVTNQST